MNDSPPYVDDGSTAPTEEPPECVNWIGDERGVIMVEATRPFIEWMELEANESEFCDDIPEWMLAKARASLVDTLQNTHGFRAEIDVEIPEDFARRIQLYYNHLDVCGSDPDFDDLVLNHMKSFEPTWYLDGEPLGASRDRHEEDK